MILPYNIEYKWAKRAFIQSIRIKLDHLLTQKIPKKVNFIRYITKADDDSISVGETKVIPIYHSKGSALHSHRLLDEQKTFLSVPLGLIWTTWKLSLLG